MLFNARYERKFIAQGHTLAEVLTIVQRHPAAFRQVYPARVVNNVYLDSPALSNYYDHVNGVSNRVKTRVRWYGSTSIELEKPVLEQKLKRGLVGGKSSHPLPAFSLDGARIRACLSDAIRRADLPGLLRFSLHHLEPVLFNRYQRYYFLSADRRFRLTVDSELKFSTPNGTHRHGLAGGSSILVIELKFEPRHADGARRVTHLLPFRLARCSKYVLGIESVFGISAAAAAC